jgi:hypothetical protein
MPRPHRFQRSLGEAAAIKQGQLLEFLSEERRREGVRTKRRIKKQAAKASPEASGRLANPPKRGAK